MSWKWACWKLRGAVAASAYGDLDEPERERLDAHLRECPECAERVRRFAALAIAPQCAEIPPVPPELARLVHVRARTEEPARPVWGPRLVFAAGALAMLAVVFALVQTPESKQAAPRQQVASAPSPVSGLQAVMREVDQFVGARDYAKAYQALKVALEQYPDAPESGEAQLLQADIAFAQLHWYPEAYAAYERLADHYYDTVFKNHAESIRRREMLAEARANDFASLHALDSALRSTDQQFAALEGVTSRYPASYVASAATQEMARAVAGTDKAAPDHYLAALKQARERTTNPVVVAQLNLEMGRVCAGDLHDINGAREFFGQAAQSANHALAQMALNAIQTLPQ